MVSVSSLYDFNFFIFNKYTNMQLLTLYILYYIKLVCKVEGYCIIHISMNKIFWKTFMPSFILSILSSTAIRKELSRKAHGMEDEMRSRMKDSEKTLEEHKADQKAINAGQFQKILWIMAYTFKCKLYFVCLIEVFSLIHFVYLLHRMISDEILWNHLILWAWNFMVWRHWIGLLTLNFLDFKLYAILLKWIHI